MLLVSFNSAFLIEMVSTIVYMMMKERLKNIRERSQITLIRLFSRVKFSMVLKVQALTLRNIEKLKSVERFYETFSRGMQF